MITLGLYEGGREITVLLLLVVDSTKFLTSFSMVSLQSSEETYGDSDEDVPDVDISSICSDVFNVLERVRSGDEVLLDNEVLFILGDSMICCGIFMSDSDLSEGQPSISEKYNVFEECEDCEDCEDEEKEVSVVTNDELLLLGLFESLSE